MATLNMFAGESRVVLITAFLPDGVTPLPLTGRALELMLKKFRGSPDSAAAVTKTTTGGGIVVTNAALGLAQATLDPPDTVGLSGNFQVGVKVWPGATILVEEVITIKDPIIESVISP